MLETIEQAVKPHDQFQVELKLDYELQDGKRTHYKIATFIFIPRTLIIAPDTYEKADFYRDIKNYIRLKTPHLILRDFTEHEASPLNTLRQIIEQPEWSNDPAACETAIVSLKFLGVLLRTSLREHINLVYQRIAEAKPDSKVHVQVGNLFESYLEEIDIITEAFRAFYADLNLPNIDPRVYEAYRFTDEAISMLVEDSAIELYQIVDENIEKKTDREAFMAALSDRVKAEMKHRRAHGYGIIFEDDEQSREEYIFRTSVLKKYIGSILYLSTDRRREGTGREQVFYALAAGIAMLFATMTAFYFQQKLGNFSFPLVIALVIGYMFKDRIKEAVRSVFSSYLQERIYDHRIIINAQNSKRKLGVLREKMTYVSEEDLPGGIRKRRQRDQLTDLDNESQGETIIRHDKDIILYNDAFEAVFPNMPKITGINDITRYDIHPFLGKMGDPVQTRLILDSDGLQEVTFNKVYHINLLSRYKSVAPEKEKTFSRIRLVLNRDGIRRVEHL
ncbi:MAG: hypothetical protein JXJ17_14360 [Anaerolineae bacterium]|nr:hypothetical protein [Anaerolineae bacterium]